MKSKHESANVYSYYQGETISVCNEKMNISNTYYNTERIQRIPVRQNTCKIEKINLFIQASIENIFHFFKFIEILEQRRQLFHHLNSEGKFTIGVVNPYGVIFVYNLTEGICSWLKDERGVKRIR